MATERPLVREALKTPLCRRIGIEYPILQAGMGKGTGLITTPELVAAVSEAGGLGCIGGTGCSAEELADAIDRVRELTERPFGVDLLLPASVDEADLPRDGVRREVERAHPEHWRVMMELYERFGLVYAPAPGEFGISPTLIRRQVAVLIDRRVPVFAAGLGDPAWVVPQAHERGILVMGLAGSLANAKRQREAGVDVVIAQGHEAGGHTGRIASFALLPQVVDSVSPLPVAAAGAIADGRALVAALAFGAQAVWCGTRFLFSEEIEVPAEHYDALVAAGSDEMVVSRTYTGKPSRIVRNAVLDAWAESGLQPLGMPHQTILFDDFVESAERAGRPELINNPGGQIVGMLDRREPAAAIVDRMVREAVEVIDHLAGGDSDR